MAAQLAHGLYRLRASPLGSNRTPLNPVVDVTELHSRIAARAEDFLRELFGERVRKAGHEQWRVGTHGSLAASVRGDALVYYNHEAGGGGDAVELWQRERGGTLGECLRACAAWAGMTADTPRPLKPPTSAPVALQTIPTMPQEAADTWREGREWLCKTPAALDEQSVWRGWPREYVETLAGAGITSMPLYFGERSRIAFPVCEPVTWPVGKGEHPDNARRDRPRFVGWHTRLHDRKDEHRGWRFVPRRKDDGSHPGLPAFPLVLSGAGFGGTIHDKRLLIICEGEFDVCTLPLALGWFDLTLGLLRIPPAVALVGILGAGAGTKTFLDAYRPFWPRDAAALVLRDGDKAGDKWKERGGFLDALRARCSRVECLHFGTGTNGKRRDVNDAWRDRTLNRDVFDAMLVSIGWTLRDAETAPPRNATPPPA